MENTQNLGTTEFQADNSKFVKETLANLFQPEESLVKEDIVAFVKTAIIEAKLHLAGIESELAKKQIEKEKFTNALVLAAEKIAKKKYIVMETFEQYFEYRVALENEAIDAENALTDIEDAINELTEGYEFVKSILIDLQS